MGFSAVILSGGRARRLGRDKASTTINGVEMIDRLIRALPLETQVIVVGEYPQGLHREVIVTRENPSGAGPVAALYAGLAHVTNENLLLVATDMPFAGDFGVKLVSSLIDAPKEIDAIIPKDAEGQLQPLCAAYRTQALKSASTRIGDPNNRSMKSLITELNFQQREVDREDLWALSDVDTVKNLEEARAHARTSEGTQMMNEWIASVKAELGLSVDVDVDLLLDVARDAAHNIARPSAPITTYLLGIAVANGADIKSTAAKIQQLAMSMNKSQGD